MASKKDVEDAVVEDVVEDVVETTDVDGDEKEEESSEEIVEDSVSDGDKEVEVKKGDIKEIDGLRSEITDLIRMVDETYFKLAEKLNFVYENKFFERWGFGSWEEYLEKECDMKKRKSHYLMSIYTYFFVKLGNKDIIDAMIGIGWTKVAYLVGVVTPENYEEWVKLAKENDSRTLQKMATEYLEEKKGGRVDDEEAIEKVKEKAEDMHTLQFNFKSEADFQAYRQAIELARRIGSTNNDNSALIYVVTNFLTMWAADTSTADKKDSITKLLKMIETQYDVRTICLEKGGNNAIYGGDYLA